MYFKKIGKVDFKYDSESGLIYRWLDRKADWVETPSRLRRDGYKEVSLHPRRPLAHNLIWFIVYDEWPQSETDHIDHNRANNRLSNLRVVTVQDNQRNACIRSDNTSGHTGVVWDARRSRWAAQICVNQKSHSLGHYLNKNDAIAARKNGEARFGFHPNHGRPRLPNTEGEG